MKDRLSGRKGRSAYSQRKADPLNIGAKMVPYWLRANQSCRNSVTGSGCRAKCSNILQDTDKFFQDSLIIADKLREPTYRMGYSMMLL